MSEDDARGRAGVYNRPARRLPAWAVVVAVVLTVLGLLIWLL